MQTTLEVPTVVDFRPHSPGINSDLKQCSAKSVAVYGLRILMVSQEAFWGLPLLKSLEKLGVEFSFASPPRATTEYVKEGDYKYLLIDARVPPGYRKQLTLGLIGIDVSLFYACPVESGCWWVPALEFGADCHGSPAFRTKQFLVEFERMVRGQDSYRFSKHI